MESKEPTSALVPFAGAEVLLQQLKDFYAAFAADNLTHLDTIYTQDVEFRDPIHCLHGTLALRHYLRKMATNLQHYRIHYVDEQIGNHAAYLSWVMDYAHPKLNGGKPLSVRGISHLKFTDKVYYHEDCYDLGALLYDHLPLVGFATRSLKKRMMH
jgi:hypothetical protein